MVGAEDDDDDDDDDDEEEEEEEEEEEGKEDEEEEEEEEEELVPVVGAEVCEVVTGVDEDRGSWMRGSTQACGCEKV